MQDWNYLAGNTSDGHVVWSMMNTSASRFHTVAGGFAEIPIFTAGSAVLVTNVLQALILGTWFSHALLLTPFKVVDSRHGC